MSTFDRLVAVLEASFVAAAVAHCSAGGECLRYTDCPESMACTEGVCTSPAADASTGASLDGASDAPRVDAAADAGGSRDAGAAPGHDGAAEAGPGPSDAAKDSAACPEGGCPEAAADARAADVVTDTGPSGDAATD